jgi:hypothetical protein
MTDSQKKTEAERKDRCVGEATTTLIQGALIYPGVLGLAILAGNAVSPAFRRFDWYYC